MIQSRINSIKVPDLVDPNDDKIYIKENDFTITEPADHFEFYNDVENNCF